MTDKEIQTTYDSLPVIDWDSSALMKAEDGRVVSAGGTVYRVRQTNWGDWSVYPLYEYGGPINPPGKIEISTHEACRFLSEQGARHWPGGDNR